MICGTSAPKKAYFGPELSPFCYLENLKAVQRGHAKSMWFGKSPILTLPLPRSEREKQLNVLCSQHGWKVIYIYKKWSPICEFSIENVQKEGVWRHFWHFSPYVTLGQVFGLPPSPIDEWHTFCRAPNRQNLFKLTSSNQIYLPI